MLLLAMPLFASACVTGSADRCDGFKPIRPTPADVDQVSTELARQILDHNTFGSRACGWVARSD